MSLFFFISSDMAALPALRKTQCEDTPMNDSLNFSKRIKISVRVLFFAALAAFLFWRARYGYSYNDEPFCITLAQRLYQGDALFRDEWHVCQNFGVVLLPNLYNFPVGCRFKYRNFTYISISILPFMAVLYGGSISNCTKKKCFWCLFCSCLSWAV